MSEKDRNFDDVAERFAKRIYGGLKGELRQTVIWRDLQENIPSLQLSQVQQQGQPLKAEPVSSESKEARPVADNPMTVLDIGAGLGHFCVAMANVGHSVIYNDISGNMAQLARNAAKEAGVEKTIKWFVGPHQTLDSIADQSCDLILCHAVIEWLDNPQLLIQSISRWLKPGGQLSLCFYNPVGLVYHNLIRGNFDWLDKSTVDGQLQFAAHPGGLTPTNPCSYETVKKWLINNALTETSTSGIRVFSDYVRQKTGGNTIPEAVITRELMYSTQEPYKWMGRYLHMMCAKLD